MMRSYAGMVENSMSQAEARAKQVGTALARDTSGQAQAALAQIERLREEAQAHTARAVERPQRQLRDCHHPDRPAARADARPVRQHLAGHARGGAADGERSRQLAPGDAEAHGGAARAHRASDGGHPQSAHRAAARDRSDHAGAGTHGASAGACRPMPTVKRRRNGRSNRNSMPDRFPNSTPGAGSSGLQRAAISEKWRADLPSN